MIIEQRAIEGITVFEKFLNFENFRNLNDSILNSFFKIGWGEAKRHQDVTPSMYLGCIHSSWSEQDIENNNIPTILETTKAKELINGRKPVQCYINVSHPGDTYLHHCHIGFDVLLIYFNIAWKREWAGETLFYDKQTEDLIFACEPKENRAVYFEGDFPHVMRPTSYLAPKFRLSMTLLFKREKNS